MTKVVTVLLVLVLVFSISSIALAVNVGDGDSGPQYGSQPISPFNTTWPTLEDAKNYYGHDFDYFYYGAHPSVPGLFIRYYKFSDGSRNYFYTES